MVEKNVLVVSTGRKKEEWMEVSSDSRFGSLTKKGFAGGQKALQEPRGGERGKVRRQQRLKDKKGGDGRQRPPTCLKL